ncbi:MAG: hypothetical protein V2A79_14005 [Planctomycetota bacterium]
MKAGHQASLIEFADVFTGPPTPSSRVRTVLRESGPVPVRLVTVAAIGDWRMLAAGIRAGYAESEAAVRDYRIAAGDILLAARSTLMRCAMASTAEQDCIITSSVVGIRCSPVLLAPRLLMASLEHPAGQAALLAASQSTTEQYSLTVKAVKELVLIVPPFRAQRRMVALLEAADAQRAAAEESIRIRYQTALHIAVGGMV